MSGASERSVQLQEKCGRLTELAEEISRELEANLAGIVMAPLLWME